MHKKILDHLHEAILLFDAHLTLIYINTAGEVLFADSAKHLLGRRAEILFKACPALWSSLQQALKNGEALSGRELTLERHHHSLTVNCSISPLPDGNRYHEVLVELQQVDRHLWITKEEQLSAQHQISRLLVRGLAHEIKNPLGGLRGAAQLLELELTDSDLKEYTQIIIAEADRLKDLMDKMLGPNKLPQKAPLNIHQVLERVRQLVSAEANGQIEIVCDYDPSIPDLLADANQLIQALLNIVRNAVQAIHHDHGKVIFKTRIHRQMTIGRKRYKLLIKLDIIDNGCGIKPEMIGQIFYPMVTGRAKGTGLGLSIAQALINQHNGLIECGSEPDHTFFSIYLPLECE
jgi:two-component system nitrogen regulation sensor histidine kinase GlnL